ncbi:MAG: hypothetical protein OXI37_04780 [Gammaproteobacteria bacterium]|nr:hypothetical protein [Gammaproteobacteria bacterium]
MSSLLEGYMTVAAGEYMIDAGAMMDVGHATFSCPADGDACTVMVNDNGTATSTGGMATAMPSQMARNDMMRDQNAVSKAAAERIAGLIGPGVDTADANSSTGDQGLSIVTLSAPQPADTTAADHDNFSEPLFQTTDGTTAAAVEFMASDDMPAMIDGWTGGIYMHTSEDGDTMHTVVKYNDKAADEAEAYNMFFSSTNAASPTHRAGDAVTGVNSTNPGILDIDGTSIAGHHGLFAGTIFPGAPNSQTTHTGAQSITGAFRGVSGLFKCQTACTSTKDEDGNLSALSTGWTFVPTVIDGLDPTDATEGGGLAMINEAIGDLIVPDVKQDADYMIFGYWEQSVKDDEGDTTETMLPFADGKRDYETVASVEGSAKYSGPATGLYMRKTITPQGGVNPDGPFSSGQFTADAMLEANFGGGNVALNHQFSITGTISNFMDGDTAIDGDWIVNLNRRMIDADSNPATPDTRQKNIYGTDTTADGNGSSGMFGGVTHGGMLDDASNEGSWSGTFHGDSTADQPTSASGIFDAHFTNGHVRGAFATNIVDDE